MSDSNPELHPSPRRHWTAQALAEELQPQLSGLESFRSEVVAKRRQGYQILIIAGLICAGVSMAGFALAPPVGVIGGIIAFVITAIVVQQKYFGRGRELYRQEYKRRVIGGMTALVAPDMAYYPDRGIAQEWFFASGLHGKSCDRYSCEDLFEGRVGKTNLSLSEVHAEEKRRRTDSKGRTETYWVTIFRGLLVIADFHKHFRSEVLVTKDVAEATFGWLGRAMQKLGGNLERMENPDFEKAFVVRATDPVEARYVLTPDMQVRMLELRDRLGGADVRFAFRDSRVFITIPNSSDWFEPDLGRPVADFGQIRNFLGQMASCFQIVEDLNLNTRIWTKD